MPPKTARFQQNDSSDDSDYEEEANTTKSSQQNSHYIKLSEDIQKQLVNDCVYYILIANQKGYPVKKTDMVKNVLKDHPRTFAIVFDKAKGILSNVFAIKLVEVPTKKGHYLLINKLDFASLDSAERLPQFWSDTENAIYGLLFLILSVIFMNGNLMPETVMWHFLKKLGLDVESDVAHPLFGNIKKLVTQEFVRKLYLEHKLIQGSEPPLYEFRWGQRAFMETSKADMLNLMSNLYDKVTPKDWTAQYQEATQEEQPRAGTSKQ